MATISTLAKGGAGVESVGSVVPQIVKHELTIAKFLAAGGVTTDLVLMVTLPAKTIVRDMVAYIADASISLGAGPRVDIGDSTAVDTWVSNASTVTNGTVLTIAETDNYKYYASADYIKIKITGGTIVTGGTICLVFTMINCARDALAIYPTSTN